MNRRVIFKEKNRTPLNALVVKNFKILDEIVDADPEKQVPFEAHYSSTHEDIQFVYVDDPISECVYVIVSGADRENGCAEIESHIPVWTNAELLAAWASARSDSDRIAAILRVGVAAPFDFDESFAKALGEGLSGGDSAVREASLAAIAYRDWPEFDTALNGVMQRDPDERCRERARIMLEVRAQQRKAAAR